MNRTGSRCSRRVLAVALLLAMAACAGMAKTASVCVGTALPAPWGAVTIETSVPMGYGW